MAPAHSVNGNALSVSRLGKRYLLGERAGSRELREVLNAAVTAPFRKITALFRPGNRRPVPDRTPEDSIWAIRDISFEVRHGEIVGIIGGNGAGKSTLLKVLSRVTGPTEGQADLHGRVGSL